MVIVIIVMYDVVLQLEQLSLISCARSPPKIAS